MKANDVYEREGFVIAQHLVDRSMATFLQMYMTTVQSLGRSFADRQAPESHSFYGDPAFDTLLLGAADTVSKVVGAELLPTYSYARIYRHGAVLAPHVDRPSCEHSVSLHLGANPEADWPIFVRRRAGDAVGIDLSPGDAVVYRGCEIEHWRERFDGDLYFQVFLHFVEKGGEYAGRVLDGRSSLGAPPVGERRGNRRDEEKIQPVEDNEPLD